MPKSKCTKKRDKKDISEVKAINYLSLVVNHHLVQRPFELVDHFLDLEQQLLAKLDRLAAVQRHCVVPSRQSLDKYTVHLR
jgi:hypothetical protein